MHLLDFYQFSAWLALKFNLIFKLETHFQIKLIPAVFVSIKWDHNLYWLGLVRLSLVTDQIGFGFHGLRLNIGFAVNYQQTYASIIDILIDLFTLED